MDCRMTSALAGLEKDDVVIDIILVNYFMSADLKLALDRLGNWRRGTVWIVDNSCDATEGAELKKLARDCPTVRILTAAENLGFGRGCNWAWALSVAPHVLLLNPDAQIDPTDIKRLSARLSRQSDSGSRVAINVLEPRAVFFVARTEQSITLDACFVCFEHTDA
jgi:GT2 family glycosyltransferase